MDHKTNYPAITFKKLTRFVALAGICMLLAGCPFDSSVPIDQPQAYYIDNNLLGSWKNRADGKIFTLSRYDPYTYKVSFTYSDGTRGNYYPFMSFVNSQSFLCVPFEDDMEEETRYYLFSLTTSNYGNTMNVRGLKQPYDFFPRSSAELRSWISNNMNNSSFYSTNPEDSYILDRY